MRILSGESVDTLLNERHVEAGSSSEADLYARYDEMEHGLGWFVAREGGHISHSHTGGGPGFASYVGLYADEGIAIVIVANGTHVELLDLADAIAGIAW